MRGSGVAEGDRAPLRRDDDSLGAATNGPSAHRGSDRRLGGPTFLPGSPDARPARAGRLPVTGFVPGARASPVRDRFRRRPPGATRGSRIARAPRRCARTDDGATTRCGSRRTHRSFRRHRSGHRRRHGRLSGRLGLGRPSGSLEALGQQQERVEVAVRIRGQANTEVDVGLRALRVSARSDRAHDFAFADGRPDSDRDRPQVDERDRVPVLGADRQAAALVWNLARERDDPAHRSAHVGARRRADVDSAVLPASVGVVTGDEGPQHGAVDGPAPPGSARDEGERGEQGDGDAVAQSENHAGRVSSRAAVVKSGYREARYSLFRD